jgi:hypothetical protein
MATLNNLKTSSGQIINANDPNYGEYLKGGATEIQNTPTTANPIATAPVAPAPAVNPVISTADINKTTPVQVVDNAPIVQNIQSTFDKYTGNAGANDAFINGVLKVADQNYLKEKGITAESLKAKTLSQVLDLTGVGSKINGFGITVPEVKAEDKGKTVAEPIKTATQKLQDLIAENTLQTETNNANNAVVSNKAAEVTLAEANIKALDEQQSALGAKNSLEALGLKSDFLDFKKSVNVGASGRGILLNEKADATNFDLSKLSIEDGKNLANYTLARIPLVQNYNIALGNYNAVADYAKNVADAYDKSAKFQLQVLEMENTISQQEKQAYQNNINNEMEYMKNGMSPIDATQLEKVKADVLSGKTDSRIFTDPITGTSWLQPSVEDETSKALVLDMAGKYVDAGILPTDTLAVAQGKLKGSRIYQDQVRAPAGSGSGSGDSSTVKADKALIEKNLLATVGDDGFLNPDDYAGAKADWIQAGGTQAEFDSKFKQRRNPTNPNYDITQKEGTPNATSEEDITNYKEQGYSKEEVIDAGYDKNTVEEVYKKDKKGFVDTAKGVIDWLTFWK